MGTELDPKRSGEDPESNYIFGTGFAFAFLEKRCNRIWYEWYDIYRMYVKAWQR